jgi:hypothetical protein
VLRDPAQHFKCKFVTRADFKPPALMGSDNEIFCEPNFNNGRFHFIPPERTRVESADNNLLGIHAHALQLHVQASDRHEKEKQVQRKHDAKAACCYREIMLDPKLHSPYYRASPKPNRARHQKQISDPEQNSFKARHCPQFMRKRDWRRSHSDFIGISMKLFKACGSG